jgi:glycosyltransferase involved in cell wall biosynthesis
MLIVFSGNTSWSMYNFRLSLIKEFVHSGYQVCIVAPEDEYTEKIRAEGIRVITVKKLKRSGNNPIQDFNLFLEYVKIYKYLQPAFIFHYTIKPNIYGSLAAKICNIKSISITTGLGNAFSAKSLLYYFAKYLYKISSVYALEVWFLNSSDKSVFLNNNIIPESKSFILPGEGVDTSVFTPTLHAPQNAKTTFLMVSRMLYDKGIKEFVEASKLLVKKGYALSSSLLGQIDNDNPEAIALEIIEKWQQEGNVKYLGSTKDVKPYIENVDAIVLPSYSEGIPRILLEAASMGKPIITTRIPGCTEIVEDGVNGYLCETKNVEDLAAQMEKLILLTADERKKMGEAGRKKMQESFDEKIIIQIYKAKCDFYIENRIKLSRKNLV